MLSEGSTVGGGPLSGFSSFRDSLQPPAPLHVARPQLPLLLQAQLLSGSEYICPHLSLE